MKKIIKQHTISLGHAVNGVRWAFHEHPNFRIHLIISLAVLVASFIYHIQQFEFIILVFAITLGFVAEMINTSIEAMTDLITKEWREEAKIAKDVSAGMMLIVAVGTTFVAGLIFYPYILG